MKKVLLPLWLFCILCLPGRPLEAASAGEARQLRSELESIREIVGDLTDKMASIEARLAEIDGVGVETTGSSAQSPSSAKVKSRLSEGPGPGTIYGQKGWLFNPEISMVANMNYFFRNGPNLGFGESDAEELNLAEAEIDLAAYLYPGIRGWGRFAFEGEEGTAEVEEAYAVFETLPFNSNAYVGRRFIEFGLVNPLHPHFRPYADSPLIFTQLFGEAYVDDGFLYSLLVPAPGELSVKLSAGIYDGRKELVEEEDAEGAAAALEFDGHVLHLSAAANYPIVRDELDFSTAYHVLLDDFSGSALAIHEANFVLRYYFPETYQKLLWQNEIYAVTRNEGEEPVGLFTLLRYSHNKYLDVGIRYDWTELLEDDSQEVHGVTPFVTWNLTEATYFRGQYRYLNPDEGDEAHEFFAQFVFGFGPHSHRIEY